MNTKQAIFNLCHLATGNVLVSVYYLLHGQYWMSVIIASWFAFVATFILWCGWSWVMGAFE